METLVKRYEENEHFSNSHAPRSLRIHLAAVSHFEDKGAAEKVVKHMKGFKKLLDHQKEKEMISERAYNVLTAEAEYLIQKWQ